MEPQEVAQTIEVLGQLEKLENLIGVFYATCAMRWHTNGVYWEATANAEYGHAKVVAMMRELVREFPASFHFSSGHTPQDVLHCLARVQGVQDLIAGGSYSEEDAFLVALDIENFILEKGLAEVITSDLEEFRRLQDKITSETSNHRAMFKVMLAEVNIADIQLRDGI